MNIIEVIKKWWNRKDQWPRDTRKMPTDDLKAEYRLLYRMLTGRTPTTDFRMVLLEATLRERGIYIRKGVDCYFETE